MSARKSPPKQRQVTVQPQEPKQPQGSPQKPKRTAPRKAGAGEQDRRGGSNRDGLE